MFSKLRVQITATAAGVACLVVAVVAAGFTVYAGFRLIVSDVIASGLTAAIFLVLAVALLAILQLEEARSEEPALRPTGVKRWASLAGEIAAAFAAGALGTADRRRRTRG